MGAEGFNLPADNGGGIQPGGSDKTRASEKALDECNRLQKGACRPRVHISRGQGTETAPGFGVIPPGPGGDFNGVPPFAPPMPEAAPVYPKAATGKNNRRQQVFEIPPLAQPLPPGGEIPMPPPSPGFGRGGQGRADGIYEGYGRPPVVPPGPGGDFQNEPPLVPPGGEMPPAPPGGEYGPPSGRTEGGYRGRAADETPPVAGDSGRYRQAEEYDAQRRMEGYSNAGEQNSPEMTAKQILSQGAIPGDLQLTADKKFSQGAVGYIHEVQAKLKGTGYDLEIKNVGGTDLLVLKYDNMISDVKVPLLTQMEYIEQQCLEKLWKDGKLPRTKEEVDVEHLTKLGLHFAHQKPGYKKLTSYLQAREQEEKIAREMIETGQIPEALKQALRNPQQSEIRYWNINELLKGKAEMRIEEDRPTHGMKNYNYRLFRSGGGMEPIVEWL